MTATVTDDTSVVALPDASLCPKLKWTSDLAPGVIATGCQAKFTFGVAGPRVITASYTDAHLAKGSASVSVNLVAPKPGAISASIVTPQDGFAFNVEQPITPQAQVKGVVGTPMLLWNLTDVKSKRTRQVPVGQKSFTIAEIYPDLASDFASSEMVLTLVVESSSGQRSEGFAVKLVKQAVIH